MARMGMKFAAGLLFGFAMLVDAFSQIGVWRFADTSVPSPVFRVDESTITLETRASAVQCSYHLVEEGVAACWGFRVVRHRGAVDLSHARKFYSLVRNGGVLVFAVKGNRATVRWAAPGLEDGEADFIREDPEL